MIEKFKWEIIEKNDIPQRYSQMMTERAKVFGGWVLRSQSYFAGMPNTVSAENFVESMVFIPDPKHEWKIAKPYLLKKK